MKTFIKRLLLLYASFLIIAFVIGLIFNQRNQRLITQKLSTQPPNPFNLKHQFQENTNRAYPFPLIIAHRGGSQLAPENTMAAFKNAVELGVDFLEMDLWLTRDDLLVVHHDPTINRTSDGEGAISNYTYQELLSYNFGHHFQSNNTYPYRNKENKIYIPTFTEIIDNFFHPLKIRKKKHRSLKMIVEIKNKGERGKLAAIKLIETLQKYKLTQKVIIGSFHDSVIDYLANNYKNTLYLGAGSKQGLKFVINSLVSLNWFHLNAQVMMLPPKVSFLNLSTDYIFEMAKNQDLALQYWTVNDQSTMQHLINRQADGIMTDRPDLLKKLKTKWIEKNK